MDQKLFNERIAMSLLRQCAWVWEHCTKNPNDGEFRLADILQGIGKNSHKSKPGNVIVDTDFCKHWDVFNVTQPIDGLEFDREEMKSRMFFPTNDGMGFGCSFYIDDVFRVTQDFCGNYGLVKKAVFFNRGGERYASLPEVKRPSAKASRRKAKVRPIAKAEPTLAERLRAALLERLAA